MKNIWEISQRQHKNIIDQLLANRGVVLTGGSRAKKVFFEPDFESDLHPFAKMKGLEGAVSRIVKAKESNETIGIFSDYDADGIPGAALLYRTLEQIGIKAEVYIPNREVGYGLSEDGIDFLISKKCSLIVTIDLGIRSVLEAVYCREKGVDLIITDHHLPGDEIPAATIVVNPKQPVSYTHLTLPTTERV